MKRSEALKIIDDTYGEFCADWIKADLSDLERFVAFNERILSALEKAGMLPPPLAKDVDDVNDAGIHYRCTYKLNIDEISGDHISNWEPEDE